MGKRRLSIRYKNLVNYIENENKSLTGFLTEAIKESRKFHDGDNKLWRSIEDLYTLPLTDSEFGELTKTIIDIFEDNYELEEPKYHWKFKELRGLNKCDLYFGSTFDDEPLLVSISNGGAPEKCTRTELCRYLLGTNLTVDSFTPVEEIEND